MKNKNRTISWWQAKQNRLLTHKENNLLHAFAGFVVGWVLFALILHLRVLLG